MKKLKWRNGTVLRVGRLCLWSGNEEISWGNVYRWEKALCLIKKIEGREVTFYCFKHKQVCTYSTDSCSTFFYPLWRILKK